MKTWIEKGKRTWIEEGNVDVAKGRIQIRGQRKVVWIRGFVGVHGRTWEHNNNKRR